MSGEERDVPNVAPTSDQGKAAFVAIDDDALGQDEGKHEKHSEVFGVVIETNDDTPITPSVEPRRPPQLGVLRPRRIGAGTYAMGSIVALLAVYWATSLGGWVLDQLRSHGPIGYLILPFVIAALFFPLYWLWSEISTWQRLVVADRLRVDLSDTHQSESDKDRFMSALRLLEATMEEPRRSAITSFLETSNTNLGADELRIILEHDVIHPMDDDALAAVHRAVRDSFFLGLVSPTPLTDTAAFVIRATGMVRAVALAYGHRPGKLGLYSLMRRMLADVAILSSLMILMGRASSIVGRAIEQGSRALSGALKSAGDPIFGSVVGAVGELTGGVADVVDEEITDAVAAAMRMAQLGLLAIAVSRPIILSSDRKAELSSRLREKALSLSRTDHQPTNLDT